MAKQPKSNGFRSAFVKPAQTNSELNTKYCTDQALHAAQQVLSSENITEEEFLGAQGVLLLNGLI